MHFFLQLSAELKRMHFKRGRSMACYKVATCDWKFLFLDFATRKKKIFSRSATSNRVDF